MTTVEVKKSLKAIQDLAEKNGVSIAMEFEGKRTELGRPKQENLFPLSDSERKEKVEQLLGVMNEIDYLTAERKEFLEGNTDSMKDAQSRLKKLREDLGLPESHLGPQMLAARDAERAT